ncbi:hypothetical protein FA15DRAFT_676221 [Coprinopsis marcescibilis]|uniref:Uncharacterized protein n=1 Tax=Coprinopsis marcescibilis TaxID=230819 RepID=A0A5C3KAV7_COPMA|nr:hypothetical protein FA15DRAFT_676221 [Coprinopsis marcescibilis]
MSPCNLPSSSQGTHPGSSMFTRSPSAQVSGGEFNSSGNGHNRVTLNVNLSKYYRLVIVMP